MAPSASRHARAKDAGIARSLAKDCYSEVRSAINKYLDDHPAVAPSVLRMMERGLFEHQADEEEAEEVLQKSQNKVELLPLYWLQNLVSHLCNTHHKGNKEVEALVQKMLAQNKKSLLRVVVYICKVDPKCAVPSRKRKTLFTRLSELYVEAGNLLAELEWDDEGNDVNWEATGVFQLVAPTDTAQAKIVHRKDKKEVVFPASRAWQDKWYVKDNYSPSSAILALKGGSVDDEVVLYKLFARANTPVDGYLLAKTIGDSGAEGSTPKRQRTGGILKKAGDLQLNLPPVLDAWGGADSAEEEEKAA